MPDVYGANGATRRGHIRVLEWLASRSPTILPNSDGFIMATDEGQTVALEWLERHGTDSNGADWAAGHLEVRWVLQTPSSAYWPAHDGLTPILD